MEWEIWLLLINTKIDFIFRDTSDMNRENSNENSIFSDEEYASLYSFLENTENTENTYIDTVVETDLFDAETNIDPDRH